eukprot:TRINITY_DN19844_c0_g1_i1.p1 TRINITY_DN19844_c0_g1~~TRINITY_DN19844_c0_g1_i1.p1  ORF type:complete len:311 (+),score=82.47 TRINITY_DN19844_c0_g1_i1:130-1062(+)
MSKPRANSFRFKPAGAARCPSANLRKAQLLGGHAFPYPGVVQEAGPERAPPVPPLSGGTHDFWGRDLCTLVSQARGGQRRRQKRASRDAGGRGVAAARGAPTVSSYILSEDERSARSPARPGKAARSGIVSPDVDARPPQRQQRGAVPLASSGEELPPPASRFMPFLAVSSFSPTSDRLFLPSTSKMLTHGKYHHGDGSNGCGSEGQVHGYASLPETAIPPAASWSYAQKGAPPASPLGPPPAPEALLREPQRQRFKNTALAAPAARDPRRVAGVHGVTLSLPDPFQRRLVATQGRQPVRQQLVTLPETL